jgi:hypothetical protein
MNVPGLNNAMNGPLGAYCRTGVQCTSFEYAFLNYTMYEINKSNVVGIRNEYYNDATAQRTGYRTGYYETTIGWNHYFSESIYIRPEVGYYHAFNAKVFNNGTRKDQVIAATDIIIRY